MPMLDINHPRMLQPTPSSPASLDPSPLHNMLALDHAKVSPGHLYVCQPNAIQIIQLVEGPPPPPRRISSVLGSTAAGSSYPSTSDSEEGSEQCSSYCSSIVTPDESSKEHEPAPWTDETYSIRMRRVRAWRDAAHDASSSPPLKRRMTSLPNDDDHAPFHTPKRSCSAEQHMSRLNGFLCSACDALFPTKPSLRQHGHMPQASEACRVAVEYNFE